MTVMLIVIIACALIFDFINGFHDAANSIATIVSTKVLTPVQAVIWAAFFNFVAYFLFKDHGVANTIAKTVHEAAITLPVVLSGLLAAIGWNLLTWWYGIPSSSSHTLIGGFAGAAIAHAGFSSISPEPIIKTVSFIVLAPLIGMFMAFIISLWFIHAFTKSILPKIVSLCVIVGLGIFLYTVIITDTTRIAGLKTEKTAEGKGVLLSDVFTSSPAKKMGLRKGDILFSIDNRPIASKGEVDKLLRMHYDQPSIILEVIRDGKNQVLNTNFESQRKSAFWNIVLYGENFKWILLGLMLLIMAIATLFLSGLSHSTAGKVMKRLQLVSSAAFSIGHGGNDAQKVMGIIMVALIASDPAKYQLEHMVWWVPLACYAAISAGTLSGGSKIIKTMGTRITKVTPFEGVAAETAGALTLFLTEQLKIPVSTTHTITGSIIGVGATKRLSAVRWGVTISLLWAWILTIPVSALLAAGVYGVVHLFTK